MDNLVFEESVNAEIDQSEFISKKWIYVNDSNSQNYTSQVVIDSTPLANSGGWINWAEGYIVMPLVVELSSATAGSIQAGQTLADHSWAFKSGFWNMINSMTLEFNNQNVVQQTPFLNVFRSFKAMTSFSTDDVINEGATIGFYPDNPASWSFALGATTTTPVVNTNPLAPNGTGLCNNRAVANTYATSIIAGGAITAGSYFPIATGIAGETLITSLTSGASNPSPLLGDPEGGHNQGFAKRQGWYGYDPANDTLGQGAINSQATAQTTYRAYRLPASSAGNGKTAWSIMAKLRLKDLSDFFLKTPLLKGSTIRFYINTNQTSITYAKTSGTYSVAGVPATYSTLNATAVSVLGGLTNPLMIASAGLGQGSSALPADTYTLSVNIFKSPDGLFQTPLNSCRLYAPVYKMNPLAEQRYLQLAPTKKVEYCDIFQYQFNAIDPQSNFNILVSNGISDIQSVLVVPFLSPSANGTSYSTLLSPFSTSGATPDPITLTNFNILVSGINLFLNNEYYDYEQFNQELKSSNQLNGNLTTGLTSGLISEDAFSRGMRYYYGNCARVLPSEVGVSRSVQIQGQNVSLVQCNLMVFVEFKRSITIDLSTGARIE
jgi:hypothetical protein